MGRNTPMGRLGRKSAEKAPLLFSLLGTVFFGLIALFLLVTPSDSRILSTIFGVGFAAAALKSLIVFIQTFCRYLVRLYHYLAELHEEGKLWIFFLFFFMSLMILAFGIYAFIEYPHHAAEPKSAATQKPTVTAAASAVTPEPSTSPEFTTAPEPTAAPVMTEAQIDLPSGTEMLPVRIWYCEEADFTVCLPGKYATASDSGSGDSQSLFLWTEDLERVSVSAYPANYPDLSSVSEDRLNKLMESYLDWEKGMDYEDLGHRVLETQDAVWLWAGHTVGEDHEDLEVWTFLNGYRISFLFSSSYDGIFNEDDLALCEWAVRSFRLGKYSEVPA